MSQRVRGLLDRLLARRKAASCDGVSDAELLRRYSHDRDEAAFELLVWRYGTIVLGLCRRALRDEQLAEDAFQAVFLVLARKAGGVRGNLGGWLFKVARRVSVRAAARRPVTQTVPDTPGKPVPDPLERGELSELLDAEVALLPARLRHPVVLCYLGGVSTEDAARELGCPRGTVLSRLAAARARLATRLTRRGITLPGVLVAVGGASLAPRAVSATLALARQFAFGSGSRTTSISLAHGVLRTMNRTALFTALGGVLLAAALSGVGLVVAQNGSPVRTASTEAVATSRIRETNEPLQPKSDTADSQRDFEQKQEKLEDLAVSLRSEIYVTEKSVAHIERDSNRNAVTLSLLQKRWVDVEQELARTLRELGRLDAEAWVLKKRLVNKSGEETLDDRLRNELKKRAADLEIQIDIKKEECERLRQERDTAQKTLDNFTAKDTGGSFREGLDSQREMLMRVERQILLLRAQRKGVTFAESVGDAKFDAILKELAALRKEVQELKRGQK